MKYFLLVITVFCLFAYEPVSSFRKCFPLSQTSVPTHPATNPPATVAPTNTSTNPPVTPAPVTPPSTNASTPAPVPVTPAQTPAPETVTTAPTPASVPVTPAQTSAPVPVTPAQTSAPGPVTPAPTNAQTPVPVPVTPAPTNVSATTTASPTSTLQPSNTVPRECAYWMRYNLDKSPETIGFYAGDSIVNGAPVYIGWGFFQNDRLPARIQTISSTTANASYTPNGYIWRDQGEYTVKYPEYLVLPHNCNCSWQPPSNAINVRGLILTGDPVNDYAIGRVVFSNGLVSISRVVIDPSSPNYLQQWYIGPQGVAMTDRATQLLVCQSIYPHTTPPVIDFQTKACGVWSPVNSWLTANYTGFYVGQSRVGNNAYIGRGHLGAEFYPGRYQMERSAGTYVANNGDTLATISEWLVVPQNCQCSLQDIATAKASLGLITVPSSTTLYGIAMYTLANVVLNNASVVTVSRVDYFTLNETYVDYQNHDQKTTATKLLVCELP